MPEDQETTTTPRRRSRRQQPEVPADQNAAAARSATAGDATPDASSTPAPRRRATRRVPSTLAAGESAPYAETSAEAAPRPARRRATRASGVSEAPSESAAPAPATAAESAPAPAARRGRRPRQAAAASAETPSAEVQQPANLVVPASAPVTPSPRGPIVRPYRFGRSSAPQEPSREESAREEPAAAAPSSQQPMEQAPSASHEQTGQTQNQGPMRPEAAESNGSAEIGPDGILRRTASDVPVRPLRRRWGRQQEGRDGRGREGIAPHIPGSQGRGGQPYSGAQGRGGQNGTARGPVPYNPAGRGQQGGGATSGYEPAPYAPNQGHPAHGGGQVPYPPYGGYEPYPAYGTAPPENSAPGQNRGRGRYGQRGYNEPRTGRGPGQGSYTGTNRTPRQESYREPAPAGRGLPGRGPVRTPHERRIGGRYNRVREQSAYPPVTYAPAAEAEGQAPEAHPGAQTAEISGIVWLNGGAGLTQGEILDARTLKSIARINPEEARRIGLRSGDLIAGLAEERVGRSAVVTVESINGERPANPHDRPVFEQLTASFPDRRIKLEQGPQPVSARIIDLFAPLGFGSRALIVAPPKTGKTTLIREAAESVLKGYPDAVVMAVLVGERPEEVTDLRGRLEPRGGLVFAASFDEDTQRHAWLVQVAVERAKRVAETGKDAFMVLDSLTRLARAENLAARGVGRTLSGGIDAQALDTGRRAFGAARNLEEGGSITILATCLVDTGSRQDDVVYEEFKGTGNMELHLSRELSQRRLFPSVDAVKSGTRREEMLLSPEELRAATALRRRLADLPVAQATQQLLSVMERTPSNTALISAIEASGWNTTPASSARSMF
ncbi:MAG TPA: transcription termination factor Rho [Ktedonobacterales bacterium]